MPLTKPMPDAGSVAENTAPSRDRAVDVARLAALVVVMFGHCALLLATIDTDGLRIGNLLGELPAIAPITWVVQVMPCSSSQAVRGAYGWRSAPVGHVAVHPGAAVPARFCISLGGFLVVGGPRATRGGTGRECARSLVSRRDLDGRLVLALTRMRSGSVAVAVASSSGSAPSTDPDAVGMPMSGVANFDRLVILAAAWLMRAD
jgi:hypothetical protein